jgi:hypothetical protein
MDGCLFGLHVTQLAITLIVLVWYHHHLQVW